MDKNKFEIVLDYFKKISEIPRCSLNEREISDYLVKFAKENNFEVYQDDLLNVIIKKEATKGYENASTVILQGHMDMVCEKNEDVIHDFTKDPIELIVNGDYMSAKGTTLGADNGIAVAFCLAILSSKNIPHPAIEVLITSREEIGLLGANAVDGTRLNGKILINIDAEEEGVLFTSCAGGIRSAVKIPITYENVLNDNFYEIKITGLKGGHSGMEIDKNRANSNKLLGRVLKKLSEIDSFRIAEVSGGMKVNAIPREAMAKVIFDSEKIQKIEYEINNINKTFRNEFHSSDSDISIKLIKINNTLNKIFSNETQNKLISLFTLMPSGVKSMSSNIEGLVESSTNLGIVRTDEEFIIFNSSTRSSVGSLKTKIIDEISKLSEILNLEMETFASYPEWEYKEKSYIRDLFVETYSEMYHNKPVITAIHAGLECGILSEKIENSDMIAFGPNIYDVHTPNEKISISSTENTWNYFCEILKRIK